MARTTGKTYYLIEWPGEGPTGALLFNRDEMTFHYWDKTARTWVEDNRMAAFVMGDDAGKTREVTEAEVLAWTGTAG